LFFQGLNRKDSFAGQAAEASTSIANSIDGGARTPSTSATWSAAAHSCSSALPSWRAAARGWFDERGQALARPSSRRFLTTDSTDHHE
jgi:hypothetical protein